MFGGSGGGFGRSSRGSASGKFKGQDVSAELNLGLRDAAKPISKLLKSMAKK
jgi:curved DNA-binding protein